MEKENLIGLEGRLIAFYSDKDDIEKFDVGKIVDMYDDAFLIQSFSQDGVPNNIILLRFTDVYSIKYQNKYLNNLEILINNFSKIAIMGKVFKKKNNVECGLDFILNNCYRNKTIVTVSLIYGIRITGIIEEYINDNIKIMELTQYGENDGITIIMYEDIDAIYFNGIDENLISFILSEK